MASAPKKRTFAEKEPENRESDDSNSELSNYEEIEADFEGRNPEPVDFDGIRQLLKQLFLKEHIDITQLADMIIAQSGIGSVLKQSYDNAQDDDDDSDMDSTVFGISTVINLSAHQKTPVVKQLFSLIEEKAKQHLDTTHQVELSKLLESCNKIGLFINERYLNIPARVADPLFSALVAEIKRTSKRDATYEFQYYIMVLKLHKSKDSKEVTFTNSEEEIFNSESSVSFEYCVNDQSDQGVDGKWTEDDAEFVPYRRIVVIPAKKLPLIIQNIKAFVC